MQAGHGGKQRGKQEAGSTIKLSESSTCKNGTGIKKDGGRIGEGRAGRRRNGGRDRGQRAAGRRGGRKVFRFKRYS